MALTLETGAVVNGADSYVSRANLITYAASRGTVVENSEDTDEHLRKAFDYIDSLEPRLKGGRLNYSYASAFPRENLILDGYAWDSDEIPRQVTQLQYELALDLIAGVDIYNRPLSANNAKKRMRVEGVYEEEFAFSPAQARLKRSRTIALQSKLCVKNGLSVAVSQG